jgi:hypothetical protein
VRVFTHFAPLWIKSKKLNLILPRFPRHKTPLHSCNTTTATHTEKMASTCIHYIVQKAQTNMLQYRPVIRKPDIRKSGYKKGASRVPAELLFVITYNFPVIRKSDIGKSGYKKVNIWSQAVQMC